MELGIQIINQIGSRIKHRSFYISRLETPKCFLFYCQIKNPTHLLSIIYNYEFDQPFGLPPVGP